MRFVTSIFLLLALLFGLFGTSLIYELEVRKIKANMKSKIKLGVPQDELFTFSFSNQEWENLHWEKENKEFKIGEMFYDVVHVSINSNGVLVKAVSDVQESILFQQLDDLVTNAWNSSPMNESPTKTIVGFMQIRFLKPLAHQITQQVSAQFKSTSTYLNWYCFEPIISIWKPPSA